MVHGIFIREKIELITVLGPQYSLKFRNNHELRHNMVETETIANINLVWLSVKKTAEWPNTRVVTKKKFTSHTILVLNKGRFIGIAG